MSKVKLQAAYNAFSKSNTTHDLARWLLLYEDAQLKEIKMMFSDGCTYEINATGHKKYKALKALLRKSIKRVDA